MQPQLLGQALRLACEYIVVTDRAGGARDIKGWGHTFLFMAQTKLSLDATCALMEMLAAGRPVILRKSASNLKLSGETLDENVAEELVQGRWLASLPGTNHWQPSDAALQAWHAVRGE